MNKESYVYILTNAGNSVLYVGVTSDLTQRIQQHKSGLFKNSFTSRYRINKLVYYELFQDITDAIAREKQIKAGSRQKKIDLVNSRNPEWEDLMLKKEIASLRLQ
nr:GIY-YIG nuclease family protein [uncultured Draconibacterium sp.]